MSRENCSRRDFLPRSGTFMNLAHALLNIFFPIYCVGCGKEGLHCCAVCLAATARFAHTTQPWNDVYAACPFEDHSPLAELIHRFKYDGAMEVAALLAGLYAENPLSRLGGAPVLVPVPLHTRRVNMRGFNQSAILAEHFAARWNMEVQEVLVRTRYTRPQVELSGEGREKNLRGAFAMKKSVAPLSPETLYVLVDDVCTTGSTLRECIKVLTAAGARNVCGLVIARTV